MPTAKVNSIEIEYEIHGDGHPLLLISGLGYGGWFWHKIVPDLAESFRVIVFDNRGAGGSGKSAGPYTISEMAADTVGLLSALDIVDAYKAGHSLGGFIAQELIVNRPEFVSKLILASTNHGGKQAVPPTPEAMNVLTNREGDPVDLIKRGISIACAPGFSEREPELVQELIEYRLSNPVPPQQYQAQLAAGIGMSALTDSQVEQRMNAVQVPSLIMTGDSDMVVPPGNAEMLEAKIMKAQKVIISASGHIFPIENPAATVKEIQRFLSE